MLEEEGEVRADCAEQGEQDSELERHAVRGAGSVAGTGSMTIRVIGTVDGVITVGAGMSGELTISGTDANGDPVVIFP